MTRTQIIERINNALDAMHPDKNGKIKWDDVKTALTDAFAIQRNTRPKIDENGNVWCNFHKTYEPADQFATITDKNGDTRYKSSCRAGESVKRKIARIIPKITGELASRVVMKIIDDAKMTEYMTRMDELEKANDYDGLTALYNEIRGKTDG